MITDRIWLHSVLLPLQTDPLLFKSEQFGYKLFIHLGRSNAFQL